MCGTNSTVPETYSWNFWGVSEMLGLQRGSYKVMGLKRVSDDLNNDRTPTTLSMFHHHARVNDAGGADGAAIRGSGDRR